MTDNRADTGLTTEALSVSLTVNGTRHALMLDPRTTLLDLLREHLDLTGTKKGCDQGQCGACTCSLTGARQFVSDVCRHVRWRADHHDRGSRGQGLVDPLQQAFIDHDAFQCGYCTPGQICSAAGLIAESRAKTAEDIRELMSGTFGDAPPIIDIPPPPSALPLARQSNK